MPTFAYNVFRPCRLRSSPGWAGRATGQIHRGYICEFGVLTRPDLGLCGWICSFGPWPFPIGLIRSKFLPGTARQSELSKPAVPLPGPESSGGCADGQKDAGNDEFGEQAEPGAASSGPTSEAGRAGSGDKGCPSPRKGRANGAGSSPRRAQTRSWPWEVKDSGRNSCPPLTAPLSSTFRAIWWKKGLCHCSIRFSDFRSFLGT